MPLTFYTFERREKLWKLDKTWKTQKKRINTQRHNNPFFLKGFKRFLIGGSNGSPLKVEHLDVLWFATTQP